MYPIGTTFNRLLFDSTITIKEIITHKVIDRKKTKLDRPLYVMEYDRWVAKEKRELTTVTMYEEDIKSQLDFNLWKVY